MPANRNVLAFVMVAVTFLAFAIYDPLSKQEFAKNNKQMAGVSFVLVVLLVLGYKAAGFGYRAYVIHTGAMFGTLMAANVWMRIWPAQKEIITAIRDGQAPPADKVAMAGQRSRHNVYMSVPLFWTMINYHTTTVGTTLGLPAAYPYAMLMIVVLLGWHIVWQFYKLAPKVKGF